MRLDEAKEILKKAGYLVEDTETNDDEVAELENEWDRKWGNVSDKALDNLNKKIQKVRHKHMDLEDKIANAKMFNEQPAEKIRRIVNNTNLSPAVKQAVYKIALEDIENRNENDLDDYIEWLENGVGNEHEPGYERIAVTNLCFPTSDAAKLYNKLMAENPALEDLKFKYGTRSIKYSSPQDYITKPISVKKGKLSLYDGDRCVASNILPQNGNNTFKQILKRNIFKSMTKKQVIELCKEHQYDN